MYNKATFKWKHSHVTFLIWKLLQDVFSCREKVYNKATFKWKHSPHEVSNVKTPTTYRFLILKLIKNLLISRGRNIKIEYFLYLFIYSTKIWQNIQIKMKVKIPNKVLNHNRPASFKSQKTGKQLKYSWVSFVSNRYRTSFPLSILGLFYFSTLHNTCPLFL